MFSLKLAYFRFLIIFKKAFLPSGFPHSVSADYLDYQLWDSIQAFASSIMNNLATQAIFKGVGVGDANATVLAATLTWILKDGTSIIGSLIFATVQCNKMDSYCKRWRLFADLLNDCAICIDLLSPSLAGTLHFTLIHCFSGILRSLVGIAGGATRAALTQHQAKANNLADVSAKDNSQERMVNLLALLFSLVFLPLVSENQKLVWILFVAFTYLHVYANYRAVKSVTIDIFNCNRLAIFLEAFVKGEAHSSLSIESVNKQENVWFFKTFTDPKDNRFNNLELTLESEDRIGEILKSPCSPILYQNPEKTFVIYLIPSSSLSSFKLKCYIEKNAGNNNNQNPENSRKLLEILFTTFTLNYCQMNQKADLQNVDVNLSETKAHLEKGDFKAALQEAALYAKKNEQRFLATITANFWNLSHLLISELFTEDEAEIQVESEASRLKSE